MISPAIPSPKGETLKPCPCCGSDEIAEGHDTKGNSAFTCEGCGLGTAWDPTEIARAAWNRRSSSSREEVRRKALEEAAKVAEQLAGTLMHLQPTINPLVQIGSHLETCRVIAAEIRRLQGAPS